MERSILATIFVDSVLRMGCMCCVSICCREDVPIEDAAEVYNVCAHVLQAQARGLATRQLLLGAGVPRGECRFSPPLFSPASASSSFIVWVIHSFIASSS